MASELRALPCGYVCSVLAATALVSVWSPSNAIVWTVWFASFIIGCAAWVVIVEHKDLVTLIRRGSSHTSRALRGLEALAFLAGSFVLLIFAPETWPTHLPVDQDGVPIGPGTYFDHLVDIPQSEALALILGTAIYISTIVMGRATLLLADRARRTPRRLGTGQAT